MGWVVEMIISEGFRDACLGKMVKHCPYIYGSLEFHYWKEGWWKYISEFT